VLTDIVMRLKHLLMRFQISEGGVELLKLDAILRKTDLHQFGKRQTDPLANLKAEAVLCPLLLGCRFSLGLSISTKFFLPIREFIVGL